MNAVEWMTDIAQAADDLGYGIKALEPHRIILIARQDFVEVVIESHSLSGELLRERLQTIPHRSGHGISADFREKTRG